ncbi:replication initiation and membrane attachment protein [Evansella vedderi]|uniref:Replication initiation and membrane attachment protein n=1 Tax=Evansella vedderi TaxID=38282 RepID=A0ABT9ZUZ4_9BACI|nr:DnaD domain protein [Evansella vedderi]MDQ0255063.1 replication initiation and membrane attachment protein [Evansella vedderi]
MHWKEILPSDRFIAYVNTPIHETDFDVLTLLYQPLIGASAYSLYMTLKSDISRNKGKYIERTHKSLMIFTGKHLDEIFQERKKLEAIGLLKVFRKKQEDEYIHYYELLPPMSPEAFFTDDMLSVFLYNRIGSKEQYIQLRNTFRVYPVEKKDLENITRSFDQVFTSVHPSEMNREHPDLLEAVAYEHSLESRGDSSSIYEVEGVNFDFEEMLALLPAFVSKEELLKEDNKQLILKMAFLYKMNPMEMSKVVQDSILHTDELEREEFRKQVKRRYRMNESDKPPRLGLRVQPESLRTPKKAPLTEEEQQIHYFETTSPIEYMEELGNGAKVYPGDIDIVEQLMFDYKLEPGVVNVLLEYIFIMHDKKLNKNLAFKIASHWSRANLKTVKEAMEFARKEYDKNDSYRKKQELNKGTKSSSSNVPMKNVRQEPLPKWMTDETWNEEKENPDEWMEAKKKVAQYREMLRKTKREG